MELVIVRINKHFLFESILLINIYVIQIIQVYVIMTLVQAIMVQYHVYMELST